VGGEFSPETAARVRQRLGLDRPLVAQYAGWAGAALRGDLGRSFKTNDPVATLIVDRLGPTLQLTAGALLFAIAVAVPLGVLPTPTLVLIRVPSFARFCPSSPLEVLGQDYVRTARAKGLGSPRVIWRHALRNALIPVVTVVGLSLPTLVGGAVLTETVFAWPGIGRLAVGAVFERDYPVIMGVNVMVAAGVIVANLLTDLAYCVSDPRVPYS